MATASTSYAARASELGIDPVQVYLSGDTGSALLTLTNRSLTEPVRLQITGFAWQQSRDGNMELRPSDDLVVYPTLVTLQPGAERKLRVGITASPAAIERTYRIFVEELPAAARAASQRRGRRNVRSKIGVPVFLAPFQRSVKATIAGTAWDEVGTLRVELRNEGTVHFLARVLRVIGRGRHGSPVFDRTVKAWYVLAGTTRDFNLDIPAGAC